MKSNELSEHAVAAYPRQGELLRSWACDGDEDAKRALLEWGPTVPAMRTSSPPGPVFRYDSDAIANRRLFELRQAVCFDGDLDAAFDHAVRTRECFGEVDIIAAILADSASVPAIATGHPQDVAGVLDVLALAAPAVLADHFSNLLGKGSFKAFYKWQLAGVVPWERVVSGRVGEAVTIVARFGRLVVTMKGTADAKKGSFACKVAKTEDKAGQVFERAIMAAQKKGVALGDEPILVAGFNGPCDGARDLNDAINRYERPVYLRALRVDGVKEVEAVNIDSFHAWIELFDLARHGVTMKGQARNNAALHAESLRRLEGALLPGHFVRLRGFEPAS